MDAMGWGFGGLPHPAYKIKNMNILDITTDLLIENYKKNNYILKNGVYQLNIFGIRANTPANNKFDDIVGGLRMNHGDSWEVLLCKATTDPGFYWLQNPMNIEGTAILVPGQYIGSHKLGLHRGQYRAFVQCGKMRFYRDSNKDQKYDLEPTTIQMGVIGCNIHHAGINSTIIDKWSAACQVVAKLTEYNELIAQADDHLSENWETLFNYTLFEEGKL